MSCLMVRKEAIEWADAWRAYYSRRTDGPRGLAKKLTRAAREQRANLEAAKARRCLAVGGVSIEEYERSVRFLEREAKAATARAENESARAEEYE